MIDIGVNLLHPQFDSDRMAVMERARNAGVEMLITCTNLDMTARTIDFCDQHDLCCTAGVHPHDARDAPADLDAQLEALAGSGRVKAIGETGLDFNRNFSPPDIQRHVFDTQLEIAAAVGLPVFVHDRDSNGAVFEALARHADGLVGTVVHCFTGNQEDLQRYLQIGCFIGITGWICDERRGAELRKLVRDIPLDRLLIETDAPFLLPHGTPDDWHARNTSGAEKRRNEPALLYLVAARIAAEKQLPQEEVEASCTANARRVFDLPESFENGG
jgi:TatD DNase family protein